MTPIYIVAIVLSVLAAAGFIAWFCWFSNNALKLTEYRIHSEKAPDGNLKIVHLSDLHAKRFGKGNKKLLALVALQRPDFIAFTGDIIHIYREKDEVVAEELIKSLCAIAPVYYVSGNHEMRSKNCRSLLRLLENAGATVLENQSVEDFGITITGLGCANLKNNKIFEITPDTQKFKLLLAHEPQFVMRYFRAGYDAVLCGHAHGGQWRIPFTDQGVYAPGQGLFPQLTSGIHVCGSMQMIISRGLGNSEFPLRLFNRPEVVTIEIKK